MNKQELLSLANKGKTQINGITLEIVVRESAGDDDQWIDIRVDQFTPFAAPLLLGQKFVEYVTDEECAELPAALERYKAEALAFEERAKSRTVKLIPYTSDCEIWIDANDDPKKPKLYRIKNIEGAFYVPGIECMLELNGITYAPIWSYWMDCAFYRTNEVGTP